MPENILIVEDKIIVARDLQQLVEGYGYNVIAIASSGAEAYSIAVERRPDLILMDIMLGEGDDGIETALKIKNKLDVAIVYASAYSNNETLMRAGKSEPYGYILKPFNEREINATIQMALYKHKAEKLIRESEKHYKNLFQSIHDAIFVWEISQEEPRVSKFIDVNDIACGLLSYGKSELLKMSFLDIMVSERFKDINDQAERLLKERHYSRETIVLDRHGRKIPVELSCSVNDFNGKTQVISIMRDIREIKKAQTTILEGEARYKNLVETIPNGLIELDNSASVLYANTSLCSMLGCAYDEIISRHAWEFIYKDDQDYFQKFFLSMMKGDKKPEPLIIKCVKKDGSIIDVQADWNYKLDELGRVVGFISVITDITEKIKITGELKSARIMAE
ncbi:MAG TPA: PAS domain S-box protein, partial [Candidatus Wallbacteria bacterium]|nr:PAS domain S-box protein [Candidatus Wallbacteria bacterium]